MCGSGELPDTLDSTGALLASVADHNSEHGVLWAVVAVRLRSSGLQGSTLHPANVQLDHSLTPDGVVCLSKIGHPSPTLRYNTAIINGGL